MISEPGTSAVEYCAASSMRPSNQVQVVAFVAGDLPFRLGWAFVAAPAGAQATLRLGGSPFRVASHASLRSIAARRYASPAPAK